MMSTHRFSLRIRSSALAFLIALSALVPSVSFADWHYGRVLAIYIAYDGSTFTFNLEGVVRNNCTCYSSWPQQMCLDRSRVTFKEETALIYMSKAQDRRIAVNVDEVSCKVIAIGMDP